MGRLRPARGGQDGLGSDRGPGAASCRGTGPSQDIALLQLENGPESGGACAIPAASWKARLGAGRLGQLRLVTITSPEELLATLRAGTTRVIVNPYGEWLPVASTARMAEMVDAIGRFVREGGHWVETGGYPFYFALRPQRYLEYAADYPPVFADFLHIAGSTGSSRSFGSSPAPGGRGQLSQTPRPFWFRAVSPSVATRRADGLSIASRRTFRPAPRGNRRSFACPRAGPPGRAWTTMPGRTCWAGRSGRSCLRTTLDRFRRAVMVKFDGSARDQIAGLPLLPVPSLIHFDEYLHGGFDKQYPDHLPPRPSYGTPGRAPGVVRPRRTSSGIS